MNFDQLRASTIASFLTQLLFEEAYSPSRVLLLGPSITMVYALSIWFTYALSHEFGWISSIPQVLFPPLAIQLAAVAAAWKTVVDNNQVDPDMIYRYNVFFWILSIHQLYHLRQSLVVGIPTSKIPYYGGKHLKGQTILVTGANAGIGKETVYQLSCMGARRIVLLCRSEKKGKQAEWDIRMKLSTQPPYEHGNDTELIVCQCDLSDFVSIRTAVHHIKTNKKIETVDVIINNAGLVMGTHSKSKDGYELMMQANYLGHFLLTQLLIQEKLLNPEISDGDDPSSRPPRVINLTSSTFKLVGKEGFDFDDMFCEKGRKYTMFGQYSQTKLANVLYTKELSRRYPKLLAYAVHPGIVRTNVTSNMSWYLRVPNAIFSWYIAAMQKTPTQGAYSSVYCAAAFVDNLPPSGSLVHNCHHHADDAATTPASESIPDAKRLWEVSEHLTGLNFKKTN
ncbi:unnamed protein product [Cylindrotheca closterium]|uniref:Protochlorophyllide reductase n=1 Tax=Cylindrotheca closterium TaxID=2856 RepID=A0AAD2CN85_9STRA|nr:unnamed protein product [Cylindrotheca closterium]